MAEWVLKGSLKGPQGDPGQDAQLPAGGTEGQVLTKTSGGEAWADVPEPDLTGMATFKSIAGGDVLAKVGEDGQEEPVAQLTAVPSDYDLSSVEPPVNFVAIGAFSHNAYLSICGNSTSFTVGRKSISAITDDIADGSRSLLTTAKAVKDYADSVGVPSVGNTGQVLTKTASGSEWQDAPEPDMTGVVKVGKNGALESDNSPVEAVIVSSTSDMATYSTVSSTVDGAGISVASMYGFAAIGSDANGPQLTIGNKSVHSITASISASPTGNALTTDKAVYDYISFLTATDEEFDMYMGLS